MARRQDPQQQADSPFDPAQFEQEAAEMNRSDVEHLPPPPTLGGSPRQVDTLGIPAMAMGGRASSPKLWAQAASHPDCTQFRVFHVENGNPTGLGVIDANATEEDLCQRFRSAMPRPGEGKGTYRLRPVSMDGHELGQEVTIYISEHHEALRRMRDADANGMAMNRGNGGWDGGLSAPVVDLLRQSLEQTTRALDAERSRVLALQQEMAAERVNLAGSATAGVQAMAERMMNSEQARADAALRAEAARNGQTNDSMAGFFQSQLELMRQSQAAQQAEAEAQRRRDADQATAALAAERLRAEREHAEWERKLQVQQQEYDRKLAREQADLDRREVREKREQDEREAERNRQHALRLAEMASQAQKDKEHAERMVALQTSQLAVSNGSNLKDMLKEGVVLLKGFGLDPVELAQRMFAPAAPEDAGAKAEQWIGAVTQLAGTVGDVMKERIKADTQQKQIAQIARQPFMLPDLTPEESIVAEATEAAVGNAPPTQARAIAADPVAAAPPSGLPLTVQKSARNAIRPLVNKLRSLPDAEWTGTITLALTSEPSIYHYIQAISVRAAVIEGGGDNALADRIIAGLQDSGLVPHEFNFG